MLAPKCKICGHAHWAREPHVLGRTTTPLKVAKAVVANPPAMKAKPKAKAKPKKAGKR